MVVREFGFHDGGSAPVFETKVCPQCGQVLFADMDVCYGCLYDFARGATASVAGMPVALRGQPPFTYGVGATSMREEPAPVPMTLLDVADGAPEGEGGGVTWEGRRREVPDSAAATEPRDEEDGSGSQRRRRQGEVTSACPPVTAVGKREGRRRDIAAAGSARLPAIGGDGGVRVHALVRRPDGQSRGAAATSVVATKDAPERSGGGLRARAGREAREIVRYAAAEQPLLGGRSRNVGTGASGGSSPLPAAMSAEVPSVAGSDEASSAVSGQGGATPGSAAPGVAELASPQRRRPAASASLRPEGRAAASVRPSGSALPAAAARTSAEVAKEPTNKVAPPRPALTQKPMAQEPPAAPVGREAPSARASLLPAVSTGGACESQKPALALRISSDGMDVTVPLPRAGLTLGRLAENDVVLHSRSVSRRHVRLVPSGAGAIAEDLGATNPILFHGREADYPLALVAGDSIDVCGILVTLVVSPPDTSPSLPPSSSA